MKTWLEEKFGVSRSHRIAAAGIVCLYLIAALGCALTQRPWCDEAWFSSPALSLMTRGYMGTPVLDPASRWIPLPGIDRYTYWIMPLYPLSQVPWYKIFGFGLLQMRFFSMFWGLVALASWFQIMKRLSGLTSLALLTTALLAVDYTLTHSASEGRPDTMNMALAFAGMAVYLSLREKNIAWAVLLSHCAVAASFFTHPNGLMGFAGLMFLMFYFDRQRIRFKHLVLGAMPYLFGGLCWGLYILQAPEIFKAQFSGNGAGRFRGLTDPLWALRSEFINRYLEFYAGLGSHLTSLHRFKVIILITYVIGIVGAISVRAIRQHRGYRALLILTLIYLLMMTFLDGHKQPFYLLHIVPLYAAILAVWVHWCWENRFVPRWILGAGLLAFIAVQLAAVAVVVKRDTYGKTYKPTIAFIKQTIPANASIFASSELGFDLGFFGNLTDDLRLGYVNGKTPDYIVVDPTYEEWFQIYSVTDPANYEFIRNRLASEYRPIFNNPPYTIYMRRALASGSDVPKTAP
jgi:4-amino-4-deoxy-L-arabinose transferase-like glycosyltransferase